MSDKQDLFLAAKCLEKLFVSVFEFIDDGVVPSEKTVYYEEGGRRVRMDLQIAPMEKVEPNDEPSATKPTEDT